MADLSYVPLLALSVRIGAPDGSGETFFDEHRTLLEKEHGAAVIADLAAALKGDEGAARRFADALVPGSTFTPIEARRDGIRYSYANEIVGISGEFESARKSSAQVIASAAISIWERAAFVYRR